jgi:DNA-binding transcriptional MerR regulator
MPETYRIGELAARTGRSVHAIRWYEAQGLIPGVARDRGGRRVYGEPHLGWLELMDRLRRTGMTIAQMRQYTSLVRRAGPRSSSVTSCSPRIASACATRSPTGIRRSS